MRSALSDLWFSIRFGAVNRLLKTLALLLLLWAVWWIWANLFVHSHFLVLNKPTESKAIILQSKVECFTYAKEQNLILQRNGQPERWTCEPLKEKL